MYSGKGAEWHYMGRYAESFFPSYEHYIKPWENGINEILIRRNENGRNTIDIENETGL